MQEQKWSPSDGDYIHNLPASHHSYYSNEKNKIINHIMYSIGFLSGLELFYLILTLVEKL